MNVAKMSPRVENGKIYWYCGNTFSIRLKFTITSNGVPYTMVPTDEVVINFKPKFKTDLMLTMTFKGIIDNTISIEIDREKTQLFSSGVYLMGATLNGENITTIIPFNEVVVEEVV